MMHDWIFTEILILLNKIFHHLFHFLLDLFYSLRTRYTSDIRLIVCASIINEIIIIFKRENKTIDVCLLNHGGIRAVIPKGDVTTRTAFEVMPFENSLIVVGLTGKEIKTLAEYIIKEKKPHPLYGIKIHINKKTNLI